MENTDAATLKLIRKGGSVSADREAIQLLRRHNILSMATWVAGFDEQTDADFWRGLRQLIAYDPDQIQALYVTPHRWTPYYRLAENRRVIQPDPTLWDYKHQVLEMRRMPAWRVLLWVKFVEIVAQARPKALMRLIWRPDAKLRHATRWYYRMGRRVWFHEIWRWLMHERRLDTGPTVATLRGELQDHEEESMAVRRRG
jgi:anaerobic magnesium-protoporphyrin IX monomethyl ester cyclase